ncbi:Zinc finger, CCCH-type [Ostreococcus tauri]|uniref:Zinc finger, CCCH-type n=1 Tax=Ostreococcus tauri TaxID=70448 RepID=A0A090M0Y8_OSTTA|nr:Zinc finger, CCCH-type [Ostreococcus tauri]CEF97846.1 Zinc finger, CCCH-type [Ostreococcus tauri]|eukprot:XP_022838922.1 Zinc finger, CCCH-type [Ostreococcus tauri]
MDDDADLDFDFEDKLDANDTQPQAPPPELNERGRKNYRQTVCRHWLRNLCMKGNACGFLHQFDKSRMPTCRFYAKYGECKEPDCPYKHSLEDVKDCNMFKLGFCIHGNLCRFRHVKLPGPPPPVEEMALVGQPGHLHGAKSFKQREREKAMAMAMQPREAPDATFKAPPLPPGPPPKHLARKEERFALPEGPMEVPGPPPGPMEVPGPPRGAPPPGPPPPGPPPSGPRPPGPPSGAPRGAAPPPGAPPGVTPAQSAPAGKLRGWGAGGVKRKATDAGIQDGMPGADEEGGADGFPGAA